MTKEDAQQLMGFLRVLLYATARGPVPEEDLRGIVGVGTNADKQQRAYNLCDGTRTLVEVAKEAGIDVSNFRKTVARWESDGVIFRIDTQGRLLHLYPLR